MNLVSVIFTDCRSVLFLQMFLRAGQMAELDKQRTEMMNKAAITIQRRVRGHFARSYFIKRKLAVITMQVFAAPPPRSLTCCPLDERQVPLGSHQDQLSALQVTVSH